MKNILKYLDTVIDIRQEKKVRHKMSDIIALVFFAILANADDFVEIEVFGKEHETFLWSGIIKVESTNTPKFDIIKKKKVGKK